MLARLALLLLHCLPSFDSREERVLELLRNLELEEGSWRYHGADFVPWSKGKHEQLVPRFFLLCGTDSTEIDDDRFRDLAVDVLRIYGLRPDLNVAWSDEHGSARLDAYDPDRHLGFELRGRGDGDAFTEPSEDVRDFLDDEEVERVRATGHRLYVADMRAYRDDEDGFTPALAFLGGLIRFLNDNTDGDDVNLGGLLFEREASWRWTIPPVPGLSVAGHAFHESSTVLIAERAVTVSIPCGGLTDFGPPKEHQLPGFGPPLTALRSSTRGAPSVVATKFSVSALAEDDPRPEFLVRYRQMLDGEELVHECLSSPAFLPSDFDLARPFVLELERSPGRYWFHGGPARIGAAAPR